MSKSTDIPESFLVVQEDVIENKEKVWRKKSNGPKGYVEIPLPDLSESALQKAYNTACSKELYYHNRTMVFDKLVESIEDEAKKRGLKLEDYNTNFHKNRSILKKSRENVIK